MSQTISSGPTSASSAPAPSAPIGLASIYAPIADELKKVESLLRLELTSDAPFVDQLLKHSYLIGGKRIRPVFLLLSAQCAGGVNEAHVVMASALEMIHTATLVHDDLLDDASTRRHEPTANHKWGAKQSVLLGDYLFTHSFHLASKSGSATALGLLAQSSNRVCEGEMKQNAWQGKFDLDEASYLEMISGKTAELCAVACQLGPHLNDIDPKLCLRFRSFGLNLGISFQIIDDILDIVGSPESVGKTLGTDLLNQKPTLPVIHALKHLGPTDRNAMLEFLESPGENPEANRDRLLDFLNRTDSLDYARHRAEGFVAEALSFAQSLPSSESANALIGLAEFVLSRSH